MTKKRLLIASHGLELGGAERSLIGYLDALSKADEVETDLFLFRHEGCLMSFIPQKIELLPQSKSYSCMATPLKKVLKKCHFLIAAGRLWGKICAHRYEKKHKSSAEKSAVALEYSHKYTKRFMPKIMPDVEYDLAVSFLMPHYYVASKVRAKKKIAFVHTDYSYIQIDVKSEEKMWDSYDVIAAVSPMVADTFAKRFPSLKSKIKIIENINPVDIIRNEADETVDDMNYGGIKILSIGRFCDAKNFESIPNKLRILKKLGAEARWYIIGFGDDSLIKKEIAKHGMEKDVIILGRRENPYPYIKNCDIYAQPSRYEGKAVTVLEAQILGKPVIISDYATASAQLTDGVDGVVAPMDDEGFAKALYELICDKEKLLLLSKNCMSRDYSGKEAARKLISLI